MLAMGAGGLDVALAILGEPYHMKMPEIWGVELVGELPDWVSAKDVILEMLRRHGVDAGVGRIIEYHGEGVARLSAMDRHVIANMGTELGAKSTVFASDAEVRRFLRAHGRGGEWRQLVADDHASYDMQEKIVLSELEPLIAMPSSPGNVTTVREVAGEPIMQSYVGSSANPGYRDFAVVAEIVRDRRVHPRVSLDINPTSRDILQTLTRDGHIGRLLQAGARLHQAGCNGCIGMGQAPATESLSLRTVPRNFPGRSGTREDKVCLVSPETAAASALTGQVTDPRDLPAKLDIACPTITDVDDPVVNRSMFEPPLPPVVAEQIELQKGPNIATLPNFDALPEALTIKVGLKVGDGVSTDEIMPAGARVLPFRSNIEQISRFCFDVVDDAYHDRARQMQDECDGHAIIAGSNYGQGSSREHAALAPRFLGLRVVIAASFARIHWQNLVNFGVLPLTVDDEHALDDLQQGDALRLGGLRDAIKSGDGVAVTLQDGATIDCGHSLGDRQRRILIRGGLINFMKQQLQDA